MSTWTRVVGNIQVDGLPGMGNSTVAKLEEILGPIDTFYEPNEACTMPMGSEGSLQYRIIEYDSGLPWVTIPIWGDLRHFEDLEAIEKWFYEILAKLQFVRDAVLLAECNGRQILIRDKKE